MHGSTTVVRGGGTFSTLQTLRMGQRAEDLFQRVCVSNGLSLRPATREENFRHFDFVVWPWTAFPLPCRSARVDVKAIKCPQRGAPPDPTVIFVELKDVAGKRGWVFGDADLIAFEQPLDTFLVVKREDLAHKAQRIAMTAPKGHRSGIKGTLWSRPERQDSILCLDRDKDLLTLPNIITLR